MQRPTTAQVSRGRMWRWERLNTKKLGTYKLHLPKISNTSITHKKTIYGLGHSNSNKLVYGIKVRHLLKSFKDKTAIPRSAVIQSALQLMVVLVRHRNKY